MVIPVPVRRRRGSLFFSFGVFPWLGRVRFGGVRGLAFFCFAFCLIFYDIFLVWFGLIWIGWDRMGWVGLAGKFLFEWEGSSCHTLPEGSISYGLNWFGVDNTGIISYIQYIYLNTTDTVYYILYILHTNIILGYYYFPSFLPSFSHHIQ